MSRAEEVLEACKAKALRLATAESCTGGMVAAALTDIAGSSAVLDRGFVTYSNRAKIEMLGVAPDILDTFGAVSEQVAGEMARGALRLGNVDLAVSITGIAGPGGSEFKPEGRVCFAIASPASCTTCTIDFGALGRAEVRKAARNHALDLLAQAALSY